MKSILICGFIFTLCTSFQTYLSDTHKLLLTVKIDSRDTGSVMLKVTLKNTSSDTVKYITSDCSWQDSYRINSNDWKIHVNSCYTNKQITISVPPHQVISKLIELTKSEGIPKSKSSTIKIGFNFIPAGQTSNTLPANSVKNDNVIWSKAITINTAQK